MTGFSRHLRTTAALVAGWAVVSVAVTFVVAPEGAPSDGPARFFGIALGVGVAIGLLSAWFELRAFPRWVRRFSSGQALLFWTAFYVGAAMVVHASTFGVLTWLGVGPGRGGPEQSLLGFLTSEQFWRLVVTYTALSFAVNFVRQVRLVLGPGTLWALLIGRYRRPVVEERVFLFLDLTGSTGLAQRLGPALFNDFRNDFFADAADAILAMRGRIYQYVGDEVVATWPVRRGRAPGSALDSFVRLDQLVAAASESYVRRYGAAPTYKAGVHVGPVVTAEVGTVRKDIVHSGDAVNVAARIEASCHAYGARLLVSEPALTLLGVPAGAVAESVGEADLRGRDGAVPLFRVA